MNKTQALIGALGLAGAFILPQPVEAKSRLSAEDRAVLEQTFVLEGATAQTLQMIEEAKIICAATNGTFDGSRVRYKTDSSIRNRIRLRDDHKIFSVRGGRATLRPMNFFRRGVPNDYRNDIDIDVDISRACIHPKVSR